MYLIKIIKKGVLMHVLVDTDAGAKCIFFILGFSIALIAQAVQ